MANSDKEKKGEEYYEDYSNLINCYPAIHWDGTKKQWHCLVLDIHTTDYTDMGLVNSCKQRHWPSEQLLAQTLA